MIPIIFRACYKWLARIRRPSPQSPWSSSYQPTFLAAGQVAGRVVEAASNDTLKVGVAKHYHLLWALLFLKMYSNETEMAALCGGYEYAVDEKAFRKWSRLFVKQISYLIINVISLLFPLLFFLCPCCYFLACRAFGKIARGVTFGMIAFFQLMALTAKSFIKRGIQSHSNATNLEGSQSFVMSLVSASLWVILSGCWVSFFV